MKNRPKFYHHLLTNTRKTWGLAGIYELGFKQSEVAFGGTC